MKLREPPQDIRAENALIGSLVLDADKQFDSVREFVTVNDFINPNAKRIYEIICSIVKNKEKADPVLINSRFMDSEKEELLEYLSQVMDSVPSSANASYYARRVHDKYIERELACLVQHGAMALEDNSLSVQEKIETLSSMANLTKLFGSDNEKLRLSEMIKKLTQDLTMEGLKPVSTGFNAIDNIIQGFGPGQFIIVAGATSIGKTSLMMDMYIHYARIGQRPYYLSLEMLAAYITQRLVVNIARLPISLIDPQVDAVKETILLTEAWDAWIENKPQSDINNIIFQIEAMKSKNNIGIAFVDHIHKIKGPGRNEMDRLSQISNTFTIAARDLKIPIVCAAQFSRNIIQRNDHTPRLSDLRDCGMLENDADIVMAIHRDDYYREQKEENPMLDGEAKIYVLKNRQGKKGIAKLVWLPEYFSFSDISNYDKIPF